MADITYMRGYGFPRGSKMDYAGYAGAGAGAGFGGLLVNNPPPPRYAGPPVPYVPEPSVFQKIPALDGYSGGRGFGAFGTTFVMRQEDNPMGDMNLPTLDVESGEWEPQGGVPDTVSYGPVTTKSAGVGLLGLAAVGLGLYLAFR